MEKILKIAIGIVLAILIFIWASSYIKSCNSADLSSDTPMEEADTTDDFDDDFFDPEVSTAEPAEVEEVSSEPVTDYTEVDEIIEEETPTKTYPTNNKPKATPPPARKEPVVTRPAVTRSTGDYMLVAGSFLIKANADKSAQKLRNLGYNQAEVVIFDNSQYYTVIARRYSDYNNALNASSKLKRKGVDNYVQKQKY